MPTLERNLRQRERINARTWKPLQPHFLVYVIFSAVYTRTYPKVDTSYNTPIRFYDPIPFGFRFNPNPDPPLVPLQQDSGINAIIPIGETPQGLIQIPNIPTIPNSPTPPTPPPSPLSTPESQNSLIVTQFISVKCGTSSTRLNLSPLIARTLTILADPNNLGTVWLNTVNASGVNVTFPLPASGGITLGDINSSKGVDVSSIFVIGTDVNDTVRLVIQQ